MHWLCIHVTPHRLISGSPPGRAPASATLYSVGSMMKGRKRAEDTECGRRGEAESASDGERARGES